MSKIPYPVTLLRRPHKMLYLILILPLFILGCAHLPKDCCKGTNVPEGMKCVNEVIDCENDRCVHFEDCQRIVSINPPADCDLPKILTLMKDTQGKDVWMEEVAKECPVAKKKIASCLKPSVVTDNNGRKVSVMIGTNEGCE